MNDFLLAVTDVASSTEVRQSALEWLLMLAGGITVTSGAGVIVWKVAVRPHFQEFVRKAAEVHTSVTVNGGKNSPPTLPDKVHDLAEKQDRLAQAVRSTDNRTKDLGDKVDLVSELVQDTRDDFKRHEDSGRKYLGQVEVVLRGQGIELPPADQ